MSTSEIILETIPFSIRVIRKLVSQCLDGSLTLNQLRMLAYIKEGMGPVQMVETLSVSPPAVSKMLAGLVAHDLVKRDRSKDGDRRAVNLELTVKGHKILSLVQGQVRKKLDTGLMELSKDDKKDLERGLKILSKLMKRVTEVT